MNLKSTAQKPLLGLDHCAFALTLKDREALEKRDFHMTTTSNDGSEPTHHSNADLSPESAADFSENGGGLPSSSPEQARIHELEKQLDAMTLKSNENYERMLRYAADYENSRKRWEKEKLETRLFSISEFARDLLPVVDAFDKAIAAIEGSRAELSKEENKKFESILDGVQIISHSFYDAFKKHGVERIPGKGEPFNPQLHNAIAKVVDPQFSTEVVAEEFVTGYKIGERVLRASMVKVGSPD